MLTKRNREILFFIIFFMIPVITQDNYILHILILTFLWATMGMSWNLLAGFTGLVSFGHAAFFGIGAYTSGLIYLYWNWSSWWGIILSIPVLIVFCILLGLVVLRLKGPFFALATLASGEILRLITENLHHITKGDEGIMLKSRTWTGKTEYYYIVFFIFLVIFLFIKWIMKTKIGYYFLAIREDQDVAESLGIPTTFYKILSFVISGVIGGIMGGFYMNYMGYIDPKVAFALHDISIITIMIVMVGGVATYWGPFVGSVIMVILSEIFRNINIKGIESAYQTLFGILLIIIIIFLPKGIVGDYYKIFKIFTKKKKYES